MGAFIPPPPADLVKATVQEMQNDIDEMDGTIAQLTHMLAAAQARLHGLLCSKSILDDWLDENSDSPTEQPEQLELPFPELDNVVRFEHGSN
jgi:hypothetical protein